MADIEDILRVERIETDIYRGGAFESYLRRTFGGQVAGQALVSATQTVGEEFAVHSLHGYFLRPGNPDIPAVFLVDRIRDGRSFVTRRVTGIQDGEAIFMMSASFHVTQDEGIEHQDRMPPAPDPETLPDRIEEYGDDANAVLKEWANFDLRVVPPDQMVTSDYFAAQQRVWFRYRKPLPDDQSIHVCTLAYMSDMTLLGSSKVPHPGVEPQAASLDHAMWFMRPFRADDWLLYDQTSPSAGAGRALTQGRIFDRNGRMVAAVTQEGLSRTGRLMPADQHARTDR
ncbi:acyl-CoA thioesterase II [Gordonia sp. NB41Y]|uniref:acyl-CoA thioesterase n=1 Tax=Gordonia sp. NB41Y TaxID=875808 RepID=UPI0002BF97DB|nr:acyl-CoA thioesterase II [Gordonia sp. NB41Y]EMP12882.1 acyl-CoA thioesterase [Gordonia sp. NB41Y]WLP91041.1 acyl-CoA thioesterase II [Gordonia sp. NB41Y]